jgi:predicted NBD/HSP70 family sugar kinase
VEHYVGIDVSLELSSVCVVDGRGKIVKEAKVASEPDTRPHGDTARGVGGAPATRNMAFVSGSRVGCRTDFLSNQILAIGGL